MADAKDIFHFFPRLPPEIRDLVWAHAAMPLPGAHHAQTFSIQDFRATRSPEKIDGEAVLLNQKDGGISLYVPRSNNDSAYLADAGLWLACRDSRRAMEFRYPYNEWRANPPMTKYNSSTLASNGEFYKQDDVAHTASCRDANGQKSYVTIKTNDLFYFEKHDPSDTDWFHAQLTPFLDYHEETLEHHAEPGPSFLGQNVAIDLLGQWMSPSNPLYDGVSHHLTDFCTSVLTSCLRTVWLVDYQLERGPNSSGSNPDMDRRQWHSGARIFTEVKLEDMSSGDSRWVIPRSQWPGRGLGIDHAHNLIKRLDYNERGPLDAWEKPDGHWLEKIGVLACEYRPLPAVETSGWLHGFERRGQVEEGPIIYPTAKLLQDETRNSDHIEDLRSVPGDFMGDIFGDSGLQHKF